MSPSRSSSPGAELKLEDFLCFAMYSASHAFTRVYKPLLDAIGLTYPQYLVMVTLWDREDRTVGEIGEMLFLESSTLTPLLKRLEAAGLLSRGRDPADERQVRLLLTPKGRTLQEAALRVPARVLEATTLSGEGSRSLIEGIAAVRTALAKAA